MTQFLPVIPNNFAYPRSKAQIFTMSRFFASLESSGSESENELFANKKNKFMNTEFSDSESQSDFSEYSNTDSDNSSDNEGSDHEEEQLAPVRKSRFLLDSDSDDDEEALGKVLKSQKEKARLLWIRSWASLSSHRVMMA